MRGLDGWMSRPMALVTGGSRGIGAAVAGRLARDGWDVALTYRTRRDEAEQVAADAAADGARVHLLSADLSDADAVGGLFARLDDEVGPIHGLVNNAGVVSPLGRVEDYTPERVRRVLEINVTAAFLVAGQAVRRMSTAHGGTGGVIVNVSSRAAVRGGAGEYVDYAASKAALDVLTFGLAAEVADEGIRVVGVRPGVIATDIHAPGRLDRITARLPLGRPGDPQEVAAAVSWLMSPEAGYVHGATLDVGGGL